LEEKLRIALLGGGPSALFMFKRLIESGRADIHIDIFEKKNELGTGMPYSSDGANDEHITNVSGNEIPQLVTSIAEWIETTSPGKLNRFHITPDSYNDYKVLPRLVFGQYLSAQFDLLRKMADQAGIAYNVYYNSEVVDIIDHPDRKQTTVVIESGEHFNYDRVVICTGHRWPKTHEGTVSGYYDSPYPPAKLSFMVNHPVAVRGASLTAIDAIRTLTRANGQFITDADGKLTYELSPESAGFKVVMHSRNGLLPAIRFHLQDSHLSGNDTLTREEMTSYREAHDGFLSLDYIFEKNFKDAFRDKDPEFYARIKDMNMEEFVNSMMEMREDIEPFHLFRAEYIEAEKSIKRRQSVYWKEMLAILSFSMNYPAKYLPAEDMQRLQKTLMPLISIVIAFVPQSSCEQLLALHNAGVLDIVAVGDDSHVEPGEAGGAVYHYTDADGREYQTHFETYIDCVGQPHLSYQQLPYQSLVDNYTVSPARLRFQNAEVGEREKNDDNEHIQTDSTGNYYLKVPGIGINDNFQVLDNYGAYNPRIYMMAVPYIGGFNPDYSGLDFCEASSKAIIKVIFEND